MSDALKSRFSALPKLNSSVIGASDFCLPNLQLSVGSIAIKNKRQKIGTSEPKTYDNVSDSTKSIEALLNAIRLSTKKLEFARTTTDEWNDTLIFSQSSAIRRSSQKRFSIQHSHKSYWSDGDPINISLQSSNDWFVRTLIHRIKEGTVNRHSQVITGDRGCGKSTLIKYLLSNNYSYISENNIVFSRFEFMKFWKQWKGLGYSNDESLLNYLSFIHARDLFLDRFFYLKECSVYTLKWHFQSTKRLEEEIMLVCNAMRRLASAVNLEKDQDFSLILRSLMHSSKLGNAELMAELKRLPPMMRVLLVGALWEGKTVVTIFDGLDALDLHDALQNSDRWSMVRYIVENRSQLSSPTAFRVLGHVNDCDSILVLRRNTVAQLEYDYNKLGRPLDFEVNYSVAPIDGLAATVSVMKRAAQKLLRTLKPSEHDIEELTFHLMTIAQRTMVALSRNGSKKVKLNVMYNLFGGDLREQFRFLSVIFEWSVSEMLALEYLDSADYFSSDARNLIKVLSSERGREFLARKSYRIVELLLSPDRGVFENAARIVQDATEIMNDGVVSTIPVPNPNFSGHLDNVFNYLERSRHETVDDHAFLKKLRAIQILLDGDHFIKDFVKKMNEYFGYKNEGMREFIIFLLQTDFVSANVYFRDGIYDISLSASARGVLCANSLIYNLAYIENVFHSTNFPKILVEHFVDRDRSHSVTEWAAVSIRNAYIMTAYLALIENNKAFGSIVPDRFRILPNFIESITATITRITEPRSHGGRVDGDPEKIAARALQLIQSTVQAWKEKGVLA